ncbi:MAG: hypothetical protein KatS3mg002_1510 [Candidatus Woesearchaeota archaeon]|nr:MAG: hypothetical protein KatS3mg002_1510 [Candidatus Woesearchaeota archaeon]
MEKRFQRYITIILSLVLLLIFSIQVLASDLSDRRSLVLDVSIKNNFKINDKSSNSYVDSINVSVNSYPRNDLRQEIFSIESIPEGFIGEDSIDFYWDRTRRRDFEISINSEVRTQYKIWHIDKKVDFPIYNLPPEFSEYIKPTDLIDITPEIRDVAGSLSQKTDDLFELEYLFAEYVRTNIDYDMSSLTSDVTQKSSWVLKHKVGVCDELTNLFISLNRAVGIPARFVSGYAYTELEIFDTNWVPHAWAEVYFPGYGWVPYDVTYGQYGFIDSGHLALMRSLDGRSPAIRYDYIGRDIILEPGEIITDINVINSGMLLSPEYSFDVSLYDSTIGFGSYNLVEVSIVNPKNYYLVADIYLSNTEGISVLEESKEKILGRTIHRKQVLLKPFEKKKIFWIIKLDDNMQKGYYYDYPISVYNSLNVSKTLILTSREDYNKLSKEFLQEISKSEKISSMYNDYIKIRCDAPQKVFLDEKITLDCLIDNIADKSFDLNICFMDNCSNITLGIQSIVLSFYETAKNLGINNFIIKITGEGVEKTYFVNIDVLDRPKVAIKNINYPEEVLFNEKFILSFDVDKLSYTNPENVIVKIISPTIISEWKIEELIGERRFILNTDGKSLKPKSNEFIIRVEFYDGKEIFREEKKITINSKANFFESILLYFNQVAFWLEHKT